MATLEDIAGLLREQNKLLASGLAEIRDEVRHLWINQRPPEPFGEFILTADKVSKIYPDHP